MSWTGIETTNASVRTDGVTTGTAVTPAARTVSAARETSRPTTSAGWHADPYSQALSGGAGPLFLTSTGGERFPLTVERWCGPPDAADRTVLERCEGAVLDIGCGPGRFVTALALEGRRTLGIDVNAAAVRRTVDQGAPAILRSVFDPVPREGLWDTALLIDGNIGIGGDPGALLARTAQILAPGGLLVVEVVASDVDERLDVCFETGRRGGRAGERFPWARLGARALLHHARPAEHWSGHASWRRAERSFVALRRRVAGFAGVPDERAVFEEQHGPQ